jgi:predicted acyl esterase
LFAATLGVSVAVLLASCASPQKPPVQVAAAPPPVAVAPPPPAAPAKPVRAKPALTPGANEVLAEMRDGVKLAGNLYLPPGTGPWPCIVQRTPYGKDAMFKDPGPTGLYTTHGYAYLIQDVRGKGRSDGDYDAFVNDGPDGYDTIEWMATQPWCNGKVGITGASAMGITANMAATMAPPHLKAAYVLVAPSSMVTASFIGGAFKQKDSGDWSRQQGISEETIAARAASYPEGPQWAATDYAAARKNIVIPIYQYGGWYDIFDEGNVRNFMYLQHEGAPGAKGNQKLRMGPFGHGPLSGDMDYPNAGAFADNGADELRWWDHWLKGIENDIMKDPPVDVYMMAAARKGTEAKNAKWMSLDDWPPKPQITNYYLHADGTLLPTPPGVADPAKTYSFDPANPVKTYGGANLTFERGPMDQRPIGQRQDYLKFMTPPLNSDTAVAGEVFADLWVATDGPDTDFMVKLVDVYPDGYEAIVLDSAIRTRYRMGRAPNQIRMMTPGQPEKVRLDLWDTMMRFEKGHRIAVHITSSNAPRFDVNPNTGENPGPNAHPRVAQNTVFMDANHPSLIILPLFPLGGVRIDGSNH